MNADNVIVLDFETTGLDGYEEGDKILSVGIATVNIPAHRVTPTFYTPIHHDLAAADMDCWLFRTKHMDPTEISSSPINSTNTASIVASIIDGMFVTTFNTDFDIEKFLDPWLMDELGLEGVPFYFRSPCLMKACDQVQEIPRIIHADYSSWPSLKASYYQLCRQRQQGINLHNALNDAVVAGEVMLALIDRGLYDPDSEEEYA